MRGTANDGRRYNDIYLMADTYIGIVIMYIMYLYYNNYNFKQFHIYAIKFYPT